MASRSCGFRLCMAVVAAVVGSAAAADAGKFQATDFVPYFNYAGNLEVSGTVFFYSPEDGTVSLEYSFIGLDENCTDGRDPDTPNSCGVHIHAGTSCSEDALGHYYLDPVETDPWITVSYTYNGDPYEPVTATETVVTGGTIGDLLSRAFVVHDYTGARVACATMEYVFTEELTSSPFVPYFNYDGNLEVSGYVSPIRSEGTTQIFSYSLSGVDPACDNGRDMETANSCGVHIHAGTSCDEDGLGHFYTGAVTMDPWLTVAYTSTADATAAATDVQVTTGAPQSSVEGRAFVVHDFTGARVACAILGVLECPSGCKLEENGQTLPPSLSPSRRSRSRSRSLLFSSFPDVCPDGCVPA